MKYTDDDFSMANPLVVINELQTELENEQRKVTVMVEGYEADQAKIKELHAENKALRRLFCITVTDRPYMDDGEASDSSVWPHIDFMRDSVEDLRSKLIKRVELDEEDIPIITYKIKRSRL